ncbi:MAG TPA: hypothetical protein VNA22_06560 [Pyrinomonadaceae bacterium]|nr:hypothetical protein [Pyrinomonadaceae bacterium]
MVERIRENAPRSAGQTKESGNSATLLSSKRSQSTDKPDDIIVTLEQRYENRRARQVGEWEQLYGQNVYRAL